MTLDRVFALASPKFKYVYDFGDSWEHRIDLEGITDAKAPIAYCTDGASECPPEDCGGVPGYMNRVKVLGGGATDERQHLRE